jgi:hypothetical protein
MLVLSFLVFISSCEKSNKFTYKDFLGTWVSTDLIDTLDFRTDQDLYKGISGYQDHFVYSILKDNITIQYKGVLYIYVNPTSHPFQLKGEKLIIDFRPSCYGFRSEEVTFLRQ